MAPQKHRDDQLFVAPVVFSDDVTFKQMPIFTGGLVATSLLALDPAGPAILEEAASAVNPTIIPNQADLTSGVGSPGDRAVNLIAGGIDAMRFTELNGSVLTAPEANVGLTADVGSAQGDGVITSSYNVYSTVATAGDAATLPAVFVINSLIYIKNDGAESMDVFPALGDNAGAGVNTGIAIPSGESKTFIGTVADATWTQLLVSGGVSDPLLLNDGTALAPTYSFTSEPDTGTFLLGANQLAFAVNGVGQWVINPTELSAFVAGGPLLRNFDSTATVPNIISDSGDIDTGLGNAGPDILSFIAGGVQIAQAKELVGGNQFIVAPGAFQSNAALPSLAFGDGDTGFFETTDDNFRLSVAGAARVGWSSLQFFSNTGGGFGLPYAAPSATVPSLLPNGSDVNTGIGRATTDQLSLIAGGVQIAQAKELPGANQFIVAPGVIQNNAAAPSLAFGDGDTGFYEGTDDNLFVAFTGIEKWKWTTLEFKGSGATGVPSMINEVSSATNPVWSFQNDPDTGVGRAAADQLNLIAGGLTCMSISESAGARQIGFYEGSPISLQTGVAVTTSAIHAALVALRLFTA